MLVRAVLTLLLFTPAASWAAAPRGSPANEVVPPRSAEVDWPAIRERTRRYEAGRRVAALESADAILAPGFRALLARARQLTGAPRRGLARLSFPWAPSGEEAKTLAEAAEALAALDRSLSAGVAQARESLQHERERSGALAVRVDAERRTLDARESEARALLAAAAERLSLRRGGFFARIRYWFVQMRGAGAPALLADLDAAVRGWAGEQAVLGAELTYVRGALAPPPLPSAEIAPASAGGDATLRLEDTAQGREVEQSAEVGAKAAELGTPAAAYDFVKNGCRLDWYFGSLKGSTEALRERRGNDVDLASLLIALLRAQGVPSRYVRGTVEMPVGRIAELMGLLTSAEIDATAAGAELPAAARDRVMAALPAAGIPFEPVVAGGGVRAIRFLHTWVEAFLPYGDYRGVGRGAGAREWVTLDPALPGGPKYAAQPPAVDALETTGLSAASLTHDYLESATTVSPLGFVRARVEAALAGSGATYEDVLRTVSQREESLQFVPGSLPYTVKAVHEESAFLPDEAKHRVRFVVSDAMGAVVDRTLPLHRLVGHRTVLAWDPATEADATAIALSGGLYQAPASAVQLLPVLRVDGVPEATGTRAAGLGAPMAWRMELLLPDGSSRVVANRVIAGNLTAIGFGGPGNGYVETQDAAGYRDGPAARFLYARAAEYAKAWTEAEEELARLLQIVPLRPTASVVVVENQLAVDEVLGVRRRVIWKGLQVDADHRTMVPLELVPGRDKELLRLSGFHGSYLEAQVLSASTGAEAVAAVSVIQEALRRGAPVLTITSANASTELARLVTTAEVRREVEDQVARGREVTIPAEDLTIQDWTGTGFIARDLGTQEAGYFLSGVISGGQTIVSPGSWQDQELVARLSSPDVPASTPDTTRIARIIRIPDPVQEVVVGERAPRPLSVFVTTLDGIPVSGADVTFRTAGASNPGFATSPSGVVTQALTTQTDAKGIARAWVEPDTNILVHAIVRQGNPNEELVGLDEVMAETSGPGTPTLALPAPFVVLARHDVPASLDVPCSMASAQNYCSREYQAGIQIGLSLWARVTDRFGNWVPNVPLSWVSSQPDGRFVDLSKATDGTIRVLDTRDPAQVQSPMITTTTEGNAVTDYIPALVGADGDHVVDLLAFVSGVEKGFRFLVREPASVAERYAFRMRFDLNADFAGVFRSSFVKPVGGQVLRWTGDPNRPWELLTGREPGVQVQVRMDTLDATTTPRRLLSTRYVEPWPVGADGGLTSFDDDRTATFWPAYEVDGGTQRHEFRATVTLADGGRVDCQDSYFIASESRRPVVETLRILPGWIEKATDDFGYASLDDLAVAFRVTNPAGYPIYARIVQTPTTAGTRLVAVPGPDAAPRHPEDPNLLRLLPHMTTTFVLPLESPTDGGDVRVELVVPDGAQGSLAVQELGYGDRRVRIVPSGTAIASGDDPLRATVILPVRNFESSATPAPESIAPDTSTEPPILIPGRLEFRVRGNGTLIVTSGGAELARAAVSADDEGNVISLDAPSGVAVPMVLASGALRILVPPADPTVRDVTIKFRDQARVIPFETVIKDAGALPIGHTFVKDVSVVDGHVQKSSTDVSIPGRGGGLSFTRAYTSRGFEASPLGSGWTHSYRSFAMQDVSGGKLRYILVGGEGSGQVFDCTNPTDGCKPQPGYHGKLSASEAGVVYRARSRTEYRYTRLSSSTTLPRFWLTSIVDPRGKETYLEYGGTEVGGELVRVFEPGNRRLLQLAYEWPAGARRIQLSSIQLLSNPTGDRAAERFDPIDSPGVCVAFTYDPHQNLASASRYDGACDPAKPPLRTESFAYANSANEAIQNNLVSHTDPNGKTTSYVYYRNDPEQRDPVPGESQYLLMADREERVRQVIEPAPGGTTTFEFSLVPKQVALFGDVRPLYETTVVSARPGAAPTTYRLDGYGASSQVERGGAVRTTLWDRVHVRPVEETDPRGRRVTMRYDANGNLVERRTFTSPLADVTGAPTTEPLLDGDGNVVESVVERWAYDPDYGGETCHVDAEGRVTTTRYVLGLPVERRDIATALAAARVAADATCEQLAAEAQRSDQDDHVATFTYCDVNGPCTAPGVRKGDLVETAEGPRLAGVSTYGVRRTTVTAYDAYGYATTTRVDLGNGRFIETTRQHDARGRIGSETDSLGHEVVRGFDSLDRMLSSHRVNARGGSPGEYRTFAYYPGGQLRRETVGTPANPGAMLARTITLDGLNLPETVTDTLGTGEQLVTISRHDAAGNVFEAVDRRGVRKVTYYDALDRPLNVKVYVDDTGSFGNAGGDLTGFVQGKEIASFTYDAAGNKLSETDLHGHRTELRIDPLYRVVAVAAPAVPKGFVGSGGTASYTLRRRFDRAGNKVQETDGNDHVTRWRYDFANRVVETVDPVGRFERRTYDGLGEVVDEKAGVILGSGGEAVRLTRASKGYDALGRALGVKETTADLDGGQLAQETTLAYDDDARAVEERDRRGAVTRRSLDDLDRVYEEVVDASGTLLARTGEVTAFSAIESTTGYEYDAGGNRSAVVDPLGRRIEETFDGLGRLTLRKLPMGVAEEARYDGEGHATWRKDRRAVESRFRFDPLGRETAQVLVESMSNGGHELTVVTRQYEDAADPAGLVRTFESDALGRATTHVVDALHREVRTIDAAGGEVATAYDATQRRAVRDRKGFVTELDQDGAGRPVAQREKLLDGSDAYGQSWSYDDAARTETWTDRRGMATVTSRDGAGRVRRVVRGEGLLTAAETTVYDGNGNVVRVVDPNGHATASAYDGANRRRSETRGVGTAVAATTRFTYDRAGNRTETKGPRGDWAFDVRETYDDLKRSVRTEVPTGKADQPYAVTSRAFDAAGNKLCEKRPLGGDPLAGSAAGKTVAEIAAAICAGDQVTRFTYDELSKLVSVVDANGGEHSFVYDAARNLVAKQDANGNLTTYGYDRLNRRTDEWQHLDAHARVQSRDAVPDGAAEGPASPATEVGALHWHVELDANGNPQQRTDPRSVTVVSTYGVLNRLETVTYPEPGLIVAYPYPLSTAYLYDGNANVERVTERKRTDASTVVDEVTVPAYDALGRLQSEQRYDGKVVSYAYDAMGNRKKVTDSDGVATEYTYDAQDRLATATTPLGVASYRYWPDGLLKGTSLPSGLEEARCYDPAGRVTAILTATGGIAETCPDVAGMVSRFDYGYDANGNRLRQLERRTAPGSASIGAAEETTYGYDALDRLVGVAYPDKTVLYQLDAVGNRIGERVRPAAGVLAITVAAFTAAAGSGLTSDLVATFNRADWLVQQSDAVDATRNATYGYDLVGNLTDKVKGSLHRRLRWSYRNTLTAVLNDTGTGSVEVGRYDYDDGLQRVKRNTAAESVEYVLDERHVLQEATAAPGHPSYRRYHYGEGPLAVVATAGNRFISTDALGSTTDFTTAAATVASMRKYDAWGQYRNDTVPTPSEPKLGFTGHQYDPETGLVYSRARYYDPDLGRFISRDTYEGEVGDAPSLHRYAYVRANPLRYTDPTGHQFATSCDTPTGAPACAAAMGEGAAAGSGTGAVATGAQTSATASAAAGNSAVATGMQTSAGVAEAVGTAAEAAKTLPWWKVMAASLLGAVLGDKPTDMTPEQRRQAADDEARRISQGTQDLLSKGTKVAVEGSNGPGAAQVPIAEPGTPQPLKAPGAVGDRGKVITDPSTGQPMSAPGTGGAPLSAPGPDNGSGPMLVDAATGGTRFVYDSNVGRYRDTQTGRFVAQRDLPYPPNGGFASSSKGTIAPGEIIDRYGKALGYFAGKPGASVSERGMPPGSEVLEYHKYEVLKPLPATIGPAAPVPAFGAGGGATQYRLQRPVSDLIRAGYLREVP